MKYTVIMSVYHKVLPEYLLISINSVLNQTLKPSKFIIIKDGPLTDKQEQIIDSIINKNELQFEIINFEKNQGCGPAYNEALKHCDTEYAMIMDSDDYIVPNKNETQINYIIDHPEYDIIGSNSYEFIDNIENIVLHRTMPESNEAIKKYAHKRCPIIQTSAIFKVNSVINAGNYQKSNLTEDYDLYIRMIINNCKCYNIQENLTYMRINNDFYKRRGGIKYLKPILSFKYKWYKNRFFSFKEFVITATSSLCVSILPNNIRTFVYKRFLREKVKL